MRTDTRQPTHTRRHPRPRRAGTAAATAVTSLALAIAAPAAQARPAAEPAESSERPRYTTTSCFTPLPENLVEGRDVRCGRVSVPARYDRPGAGTLDVAVAVLVAREEPVKADPVMLLGGGPGDDIISFLPALMDPSVAETPLAADRDIVLVNQRGTFYGQPELRCPALAQEQARVDLPSAVTQDRMVAASRECRRDLRRDGVDPNLYTTVNNARDLDRVRRALGYEQVNVFGTSYGTKLTLEAARQGDPSWIRTMVLSSPVPTQMNLVEATPASFQSSLEELFTSCAVEPSCARNGDLRLALDRASSRLRDQPHRVTATVGERSGIVHLDAPRLAGFLFAALYDPAGVKVLPGIIAAAGRGDDGPLAEAVLSITDPTSTQAEGMQAATWCADFIGRTDRDALAAAGRAPGISRTAGIDLQASTIGVLFGPRAVDYCRGWTPAPVGVASEEPVRSAIPALVTTGQYDPATPPWLGVETVRTLTRSHLVDLPGQGHSPLLKSPACWPTMLQEFLDDPEQRPDATCIAVTRNES
ncbi:MAG: alpha/beta hydrolase [Dermatophilaceae bacterium]